MTITYLGHACFLLESGGYRVILDPFKGVPGVTDIRGEAEAVYCSHNHFDHAFTRWIHLTEGKSSPFTVREVKTWHDDQNGTLRGENTAHILTADGITVAHLGDLGHQPNEEQLAALEHCDVLFIPVGGTYTLDIHGAKQAADAIRPRMIVPMHYRRGKAGFDVLQTVEEFAAQYGSEDVHWLTGNTLEVSEDVLQRGGVVVFQV